LPSQDIDDAVSPRTALPLICSLELEGLERCLESLRDKLESSRVCGEYRCFVLVVSGGNFGSAELLKTRTPVDVLIKGKRKESKSRGLSTFGDVTVTRTGLYLATQKSWRTTLSCLMSSYSRFWPKY
jgi:hypothetical protein